MTQIAPPILYERVVCTGVFDLFHVGHLRYLQFARAQGSHLTVAVTRDALCAQRKGKPPVICEDFRLEIVRGLGWVDRAEFMPSSLELTEEAASWISAWNADAMVVGEEWRGTPRWDRLTPLLAQRGISVIFAPRTEEISTTEIVERVLLRQAQIARG